MGKKDRLGGKRKTATRRLPQRALHIVATGHRILSDIDMIEAGIEEGLAHLDKALPGRIFIVYSALADGADRLAVRAVLKRKGARLIVPLPAPQGDYEKDFTTAGSKEEFRALLAQAADVIALPPAQSRNAAYEAASDYMLDHCTVLLAVWDGQEAQGQGGTGTTVTRARRRGLRIVWVHAGNRKPGSEEPTTLGDEQGTVTYEGV